MYKDAMRSVDGLAGEATLATTMLQINHRIELINVLTERRERGEALRFPSLAAMNLRMCDRRHEEDLANLVAAGKIRVTQIKLGVG